jgi:E3 ubiquitin-protein ligase listerin
VATTALKAWKETIFSLSEVKEGSPSSGEQLVLDDTFLSSIGAFVQRTALDPAGIYEYLNPPPPVATGGDLSWKKGKGQPIRKLSARNDDSGTLTPRSKTDEQEESEQDRNARLRISALGAMRWIFGMLVSTHSTAY